jgi:hypothetical protein
MAEFNGIINVKGINPCVREDSDGSSVRPRDRRKNPGNEDANDFAMLL